MKRILFFLLIQHTFLVLSTAQIQKIEWFVNQDPGYGQAQSIVGEEEEVAWDIDLNNLPVGVNQLYIRALDSEGKWSQTSNRSFLILPIPNTSNTIEVEWFIDEDPGIGLANSLGIASNLDTIKWEIDLSDIPLGVHRLYLRTKDNSGKWSLTLNRSFLIIPQGDSPLVSIDYTIETNGLVEQQLSYPINPPKHIVDIDFELDKSSLTDGQTYTVCFKAVTLANKESFVRCDTFSTNDVMVATESIHNNQFFKVYPNPSTGQFTIEWTENFKPLKWSIFNAIGQKVIEKESLDTNHLHTNETVNLPNGFYNLLIETEANIIIRPIIIQN